MNAWWRGLPAAQASVECGGEAHRLRWEAGVFDALDHGDVDSERALAALGGQRCTCLELLDAWERHRDDLRVLVLASRGPADIIAVDRDAGPGQPRLRSATAPRAGAVSIGLAPVRQVAVPRRVSTIGGRRGAGPGSAAYGPRWLAGPPKTSKKACDEDELVALIGLGGGLPERLFATVAAGARERLRAGRRPRAGERAQLQAALHGRVFATLRSWLGASGAESRLTMIGERATPALRAEEDGVRGELPFGWLVDVWAPGLATIWGRFCLAAHTEDGRTWQLTTVGADLEPPSVLTLELGSVDAGPARADSQPG